MISQKTRDGIVRDSRAIGLRVICEGRKGSTMIQAERRGDLVRVAAGNGLDVQKDCPCPLDVLHEAATVRTGIRVGGVPERWEGDMVEFEGTWVMSLYGSLPTAPLA
jgi:hypothetical protein